jgi:hypothetical protein
MTRADLCEPVCEAEELHAAAREAEKVRWYSARHSLNQQAVLDRHRWLHDKTGLDAPADS